MPKKKKKNLVKGYARKENATKNKCPWNGIAKKIPILGPWFFPPIPRRQAGLGLWSLPYSHVTPTTWLCVSIATRDKMAKNSSKGEDGEEFFS
jgi:hypothetical protein